MAEWNETTIILTEGLTKIFAQFLDTIRVNADFPEMWTGLLDYLNELLGRQVLSVSRVVFSGLTRMLVETKDMETMGASSFDKAWQVWQDGNPGAHTDSPDGNNRSQGTLVVYLDCLKQLLRLVGSDLSCERAGRVIEALRATIVSAGTATYDGDTDRMIPVQKYAIESLKTIPPGIPGVMTKLIDNAAELVTLAFDVEVQDRRAGPTYIALSKSAMDSLQSYVVGHVSPAGTETPRLLSRALQALSVPLHLKYQWHTEGKPPSTWEKATTTAVAILQTFIPVTKPPVNMESGYSEFMNEVIRINDGIISAKFSSSMNLDDSKIKKDQEFDTSAFSTIRNLLTGNLGNQLLSDSVCRTYSKSIFTHSVIHEPHPDDLPRPGHEPLEGLRSKHIGRVQDLPPSPRSKLAYVLLDELFDLVAVHDSSPERIRLAQAAAPYLILRVGITLKAYALDQPLRGRMPQPLSQKKEMLCILQKIVELEPEPKAIPPMPGISESTKNHLHRLYPFIMKALSAAQRDADMTRALKTVLDAVGEDFGI